MKRTEKSKRKRIRGGIAALPFLLAALTVLPSCSMASMFVAMSVGGERFQNAVQRSLDMNYGAPARNAEGVYVISDNPTSFQQEIAYIYANGAQFDGKELQLCGIFGTLTEKGKTVTGGWRTEARRGWKSVGRTAVRIRCRGRKSPCRDACMFMRMNAIPIVNCCFRVLFVRTEPFIPSGKTERGKRNEKCTACRSDPPENH